MRIILSQLLIAFSIGFGLLATKERVQRIVGSKSIVMTWNPWSPVHHYVTGVAASGMEMYREKYMK